MLFPILYMTLALLVLFARYKIERLLAQKIILCLVIVVFMLVVSIFVEAQYLGWHLDRFFLLMSSLWYMFCSMLIALPLLRLQRWVGQEFVFYLRQYLSRFCWGLFVISFMAMAVSLST